MEVLVKVLHPKFEQAKVLVVADVNFAMAFTWYDVKEEPKVSGPSDEHSHLFTMPVSFFFIS